MQLREYEPDVVSRKSEGRESLSFDGVHITIEDSLSTVKIGWEDAKLKAPDKCYGVLIDEDTVLTLAECTSYDLPPMSAIWKMKGTLSFALTYIQNGKRDRFMET